MEEIYKNPNTDCILFNQICCIDNRDKKILCKYGIEFDYGYINSEETEWRGKPAHTMVYKSAIAKKHSYKNSNYREDTDWVVRACKDIKEQTRIDKILYYYDCNQSTTSETRGNSDDVIKSNIEQLELQIEFKNSNYDEHKDCDVIACKDIKEQNPNR